MVNPTWVLWLGTALSAQRLRITSGARYSRHRLVHELLGCMLMNCQLIHNVDATSTCHLPEVRARMNSRPRSHLPPHV
jgi:hypothetical protein